MLAGAAPLPAPLPQQQRRAWVLRGRGSMANLTLAREPLRDPGPGEVLVTVKALGLNFADVFCVLGLYKAAPPTDFVPGLGKSMLTVAVMA